MPADIYRLPIPSRLWERIRDEFNLPTLDQVRERLATLHEDPEPVMPQLVRVFLDDGTYCPGFQFRPDLSLNPAVAELFQRAMELRIAHNYFALWMMVPCPVLNGARPVDLRESADTSTLQAALERTLPGMGA